jgi:hypothetical protein
MMRSAITPLSIALALAKAFRLQSRNTLWMMFKTDVA